MYGYRAESYLCGDNNAARIRFVDDFTRMRRRIYIRPTARHRDRKIVGRKIIIVPSTFTDRPITRLHCTVRVRLS